MGNLKKRTDDLWKPTQNIQNMRNHLEKPIKTTWTITKTHEKHMGEPYKKSRKLGNPKKTHTENKDN